MNLKNLDDVIALIVLICGTFIGLGFASLMFATAYSMAFK